ncbi:MAG: hypothetical protein WD530_02400, partial [Vicingaceae bacterium]
MKRIALFHIIVLLISSSLFAIAQSSPKEGENKEDFSFRKVNNTAFRAGEILEYKMAYGIMNAGVAKLEVKESSQKVK